MRHIVIMMCAGMFVFAPLHADAEGWWDKVKETVQEKRDIISLDSVNKNLAGGTDMLSNKEVDMGLREALRVASGRVVTQLGTKNGFNLDPDIHIPLPGALEKVDAALLKIGAGGLTDDLEIRLNRAAEAATPRAKTLFVDAISDMSIEDARDILTGPNDAATQYLRKAMGVRLAQDMRPIVSKSLSEAGAVKAYDSVMGRYKALPFMPDAKANLQSYVVEKALDGLFYYVAIEEAAIRENPAKRTSEILQKVFSPAH